MSDLPSRVRKVLEGRIVAAAAPLQEERVAAFERRHGVRLPADYRVVVTEVGDGLADVFKLGEVDDGFGYGPWEGSGFVGRLDLPFPHVSAWNLPPGRLACPEGADEAVFHKALDAEYFAPVNGAFPLYHHGCALRDWLVVTGHEAGHVWHDATAEHGGWRPCLKVDGGRTTFGDWLLALLAKAPARTG